MKIIGLLTRHVFLAFALLIYGCKSQQPVTPSSADAQITGDSEATSSTSEPSTTKKAVDYVVEKTKPILSLKNFAMQKDVENALKKSEVFSSHFTGFSLFDISKNEFIVHYNDDKYFTPASNVKILTLYATLRSFGRKLPGMIYRETNDTLYLRPTGDPTLLHQYFSSQPVLDKIRRTRKPISIEWPSTDIAPFGIGWMWDDYSYSFQPELSWMPIYGNVVHFEYDKTNLTAIPALFNELVHVRKGKGESNTIKRSPNYNYFNADIRYRNWAFEKNVPFKHSKALTIKLLRDAVQIPVNIIPERKLKMDTLYSQPIDTVLRRMMQESDNFLAEQLLIMSAWKNGFDNTEEFRAYMLANWLPSIEPIWMDGSGISRYNLIRPLDEVLLLQKLYEEYGWTRIHTIFAQGGKSGTIKNWYPNRSDPENPNHPLEPYIIAKTGTLANNHTLSGYLQTKSGKLLIFSFMNNNYIRETSQVKEAMQRLLESIRDSY